MRDVLILSPSPAPPSWAITAVTSDADGKFAARKVSAGSPSLARLVPDLLSFWSTAGGTADAIISSRPLDVILASMAPAEAEHLDVGNLNVQLALPVGSSRPEMWCWLHKAAGGGLRFPGKERLFVIRMLGREIAALFNPEHTTTEGSIITSPKLDAITRGDEKLEAWITPKWRAKLMLPNAFPEIAPISRRPREPLTPRQRLDAILRDVTREKAKARSEKTAREAELANARLMESRQAELAAESKARAREAAIRARVEAEMRR